MTVSQEELDRVRQEGARRRRLTKADQRRRELAGVVDTGSLSDDDVAALYGAFRAGRDAPVIEDTR